MPRDLKNPAERHPEKVRRAETPRLPKPDWIRVKARAGAGYKATLDVVREHKLTTVCEEAGCPNLGECWNQGHATMMIMGEICTRGCTFCNVATGRPDALDLFEPGRVADAVAKLGLNHVVITSVDRDDLPDGGSAFWAETIRKVKQLNPETTMEVLIPDFRGKEEDIQRVINEKPEVISHNMETVRRLSKRVRSQARYERSLEVLKYISGQ